MRGGSRISSTAWRGRGARWIGAATIAAVAAFHLELLAGRLVDDTLARPDVALRWIGSLAVVLVTVELGRRRLLRRSPAFLVLVLAALALHLGTPSAPAVPAFGGALAAIPAGVALSAAAGATAALLSPGPDLPRAPGGAAGRLQVALRPLPPGLACGFAPRPPPTFSPDC